MSDCLYGFGLGFGLGYTYVRYTYVQTYVRTYVFFLLLPSIAYTASASKVFHRSSGEESGVSSALFQLTYVCTYIHVIRSGRTATGVPALKTSLPTPIEKRHREMSKQELEGILVLD